MHRILAVAALLLTSTAANAAITVFLNEPQTANEYSYRIEQATGDEVRAGDFFTIYDFGPVLSHTEPANFTFSASLVSGGIVLQPGVGTDDPAAQNVTYTYVGATPLTGLVIGNFVLTSPFTGLRSDAFGGQNTKGTGFLTGEKNFASGQVAVPAAIPEPATMGLFGSALAGLCLLARRRKQ
jgi:hypothetical protein